jgi:hypothetical protein
LATLDKHQRSRAGSHAQAQGLRLRVSGLSKQEKPLRRRTTQPRRQVALAWREAGRLKDLRIEELSFQLAQSGVGAEHLRREAAALSRELSEAQARAAAAESAAAQGRAAAAAQGEAMAAALRAKENGLASSQVRPGGPELGCGLPRLFGHCRALSSAPLWDGASGKASMPFRAANLTSARACPAFIGRSASRPWKPSSGQRRGALPRCRRGSMLRKVRAARGLLLMGGTICACVLLPALRCMSCQQPMSVHPTHSD